MLATGFPTDYYSGEPANGNSNSIRSLFSGATGKSEATQSPWSSSNSHHRKKAALVDEDADIRDLNGLLNEQKFVQWSRGPISGKGEHKNKNRDGWGIISGIKKLFG